VSGEHFAGIDLGGTKVLVLVAGAGGDIIGRARAATEASQGPDAVIGRIVELVGAAANDAGIDAKSLSSIGISAPGPIDAGEGVITDPPNLPGWQDVPLARIVRERLGVPALLENDANCAAVGEHQFGAGRGYRHLIYLTVSTGIGGGIIVDNALYTGASGAAGEVGHMIVAAAGPSCGAGHVGCLEAFSSGTAIAARAAELIAAGRLPRTARLAERAPPLSAEEVHQAAAEGEEEARGIIETAGRYLGLGLASLINAFNPQAIILGGGLVYIGEMLLAPALEAARERSFAQAHDDCRIVEWELGDDVAALGAIALARDRGVIERI
jgi:glucokinase